MYSKLCETNQGVIGIILYEDRELILILVVN